MSRPFASRADCAPAGAGDHARRQSAACANGAMIAAILRTATRNARHVPRAWARQASANLARLQRLEAAYEAGLLCDLPRDLVDDGQPEVTR